MSGNKEIGVIMENKIQVFKNQKFGELRTVVKNGEPWFVAKDVCDDALPI